MNKTQIKLISIEGRWGQSLYPPVPPPPPVSAFFPEKAPMRPHARLLLAALSKTTENKKWTRM